MENRSVGHTKLNKILVFGTEMLYTKISREINRAVVSYEIRAF